MSDTTFRIRVRGEMACFTRPEFSTERVSYEIMTPSAARGVLEAILWKPAVRWEILSIALLSEVRWIEFRRNEVNSRISTRDAALAARNGTALREFYADEDRAQRNTLALRDVDYLVEARFHMTRHAGAEDNPAKFREMFSRRLVKGQQHYQPYLGCREFPAIVAGDEATPPARDETRSLGLMLHDIDFGLRNEARFFDAKLEHGILHVPEWSAA
ncbi:MAG TPA: type I-C CRISPR-associated protein Cas5c [Terriglobales bacterium]|nr:type I-C CRISPR-associated protein Cas5c [Terriglobales bacterium]